ncbi:TRAP transporter 4TM/12TM fusion protein [Natronocella acetinitrilica]|uniref:TRAP transporter 4TM/12TM fusion protein n=1 Tax=Natronocella acetinitrilica TaxID=414046 RepID=A0AAE3KBI8_9GAMM|nr:TRAP transporter fused permease subunit [Natronocella acetinitrilica]MCP1673638.1 TRAP transporter 4TM/12TM fusion protein [Natronocella acetinitrilica]
MENQGNVAVGWMAARRLTSVLFTLFGLGLTAYLAGAALGYSPGSSEHYSNFIFAIMVMAGLLAIRVQLDEKIAFQASRLFWFWLVLGICGLVLGTFSFGYIRIHAARLEVAQPFFADFDLTVGYIMIAAVLILHWLHWGWLLTTIIGAAIVYFFFGHNISNVLFTHPPYSPAFVLNYMGLGTTQGFYWLAQVAADAIYFLVLYAAILLGVGILDMIMEIGKAGGRKVPGGAAFASIFGSGVVGSVMGQAVSNVVMTGRLTIPMMKRYGYRPSMAGAIEATGSTVGQIMPPILGLAGFIIASMLNRPYIEVALAALIPGLLYMTGVLFGVLVYARRNQLAKLTEPVNMTVVYRLTPTFLFSFGVVLILLLGYRSPAYAGLMGIGVALVLCCLQGPYRPSLDALRKALDEGFVLVTVLSLLLIAIGALGQTVMTTNLSGRIGAVLVQVLPDIEILLLLGAMGVSIILGMGLPTPVAYLVASLAMVPFLQQIGVPALQAHFFVFYFAVFSTLTPPVAVSVLAAAKLSGAGFWATALHSMKLSLATFIVPFAFVYRPELMTFPSVTGATLIAIGEVLLLQGAFALAAYGYLIRALAGWERLIFAIVGVCGFMYLTTDVLAYEFVFFGGSLLLIAWLFITRNRQLVVGDQTL